MHRIRTICLLAVAAAALTATTGNAFADEIENDAGSFTGHVNVSLDSGTALFVTTGGNVNCSTVTGEGTIDNENVPNNATTEVGAIESLDFTDGANAECDTTIFGVSSCATQIAGLPADLQVRENGSHDEWVLRNVEITLICETFVGDQSCHYFAAEISGTVTGANKEVFVFNDFVQGEPGNPFACPSAFHLQGTLRVRNEPGDEVMLTEN